MARFLSEVAAGRKSVPQPADAGVSIVSVQVILAAAALAVGDLLSLVDLPPTVELVDFDVIAPQLDSNGAPTLAFSLGHENAGATDLAVTYEAGLIFGRSANGSISRATTAGQLTADKTTARRLALKATTAAA